MHLLFVADPLEPFRIYKDSTFAMMREAQKRGHRLSVCEPKDLMWQKGASVTAFVRDIRLTGDPVKTVEVLANRYTLNDPSALVFCGISSSKAICRGTGWSTPSRTTRRTSRAMTGPPSSRPWGASSSSWLQRSGRAWPTRPESLGAPSMTVPPGFLHSIDVLPLARRNLLIHRSRNTSSVGHCVLCDAPQRLGRRGLPAK